VDDNTASCNQEELGKMTTFLEHSYSIVHQDNAADLPTQKDLKTQLEKGTDEAKVETMKVILTIMLNGDPMPNLLMHIIRFVMPSKSKSLKKLLYLYYEVCQKLDGQGKLKQEMILVWYGTEIIIGLACTYAIQQRHPKRSSAPQRVHQRQHAPLPQQASRA